MRNNYFIIRIYEFEREIIGIREIFRCRVSDEVNSYYIPNYIRPKLIVNL